MNSRFTAVTTKNTSTLAATTCASASVPAARRSSVVRRSSTCWIDARVRAVERRRPNRRRRAARACASDPAACRSSRRAARGSPRSGSCSALPPRCAPAPTPSPRAARAARQRNRRSRGMRVSSSVAHPAADAAAIMRPLHRTPRSRYVRAGLARPEVRRIKAPSFPRHAQRAAAPRSRRCYACRVASRGTSGCSSAW